MQVIELRKTLRRIINQGGEDSTLFFSDQDCDVYTVSSVIQLETGSIALIADDDDALDVSEIYDELEGYPNNAFVFVFSSTLNLAFGIAPGFREDDDGDVFMDVLYVSHDE